MRATASWSTAKGSSGSHLRRPGGRFLLGRARHRHARADARRHGLLITPHLSERVRRAERGLLRHHGDRRGVLLPAGRHRQPARGLPDRRGRHQAGRHPVALQPGAFGDPDHYSIRFTGTGRRRRRAYQFRNSEPGLLSGHRGRHQPNVGPERDGVGAANREQIERVFYRAFTQMLPANATFSIARAATLQAARDLYGAASAAERAVQQAWTAVGVQ